MKSVLGALAQVAITSLVVGAPVLAHAGDFEGRLVACPSNGTSIGDVRSCGKIWKLKSGKAELKADGRLEVEVRGLVLDDPTTGAFNGTPDGVDGVAAAVICSTTTGARVVAQTEVATLGKSGDAKVRAKVSLPDGCIAPVVVLRERYEGNIGGWLAATGM
ncbi:MAG: hypothetical protein GC151_15115 [Betaproteobacteria bacterium]|nr:hypothetical protein [Betaproteobacteria bacterium]